MGMASLVIDAGGCSFKALEAKQRKRQISSYPVAKFEESIREMKQLKEIRKGIWYSQSKGL